MICIDTTIKGGLPVKVMAKVRWDRRDQAFDVDVIGVYWMSGKRVPDHLHNQITDLEWDRIEQELIEWEDEPLGA